MDGCEKVDSMKRKRAYVDVMWKYTAVVALFLVLVMGLMLVQYHSSALPDLMCVELEFAE
jgi:hypothetical protein